MMLIKNRYRLINQIGKGKFSQTFLAIDESTFPSITCIVQQFFQNSQSSQTFVEKAQQLEELGTHPQIPTLLASFQENQYFYLVQEFINGTNLATLLEEQGTFNETQIWQLLATLLPILKFIHAHNIIHGDIKPENIICKSFIPPIFSSENISLVDFATIKIVNKNQTTYENIIGSPEYIAPEQAQGKAVFASDLYSLGVTCIYLLTQIPPFDLFDISNNNWIWQQYLTTNISNHLSQIIDKLLKNDIKERFQSADLVLKAMGLENQIQNFNFKIKTTSWRCLSTLTSQIGGLANINSVAFNPDGDKLVSGDERKNIKLWDLNTQELLMNFQGHTQAIKSITFSPDGKILASASEDKTIKLWDVETCQEIYTLLGHTHTVKSVAFSPDGQLLASGSWDKTIKIWDRNTGRELCTLIGHKLQVSAVAFSPQGDILASASCDRTIHLWQKSSTHAYNLLGILLGHAWAVLTVAFSPDGKILASGSDDNTIKLWNINTGELISTLVGHSWSVVALAFTADGETLISGSWDQTIKLWQVSTNVEIATLAGHTDSVSTVAVSPDAQLIASGSRDKTIKLWKR
jgi:WD40 repeat protein